MNNLIIFCAIIVGIVLVSTGILALHIQETRHTEPAITFEVRDY